MAQINTRRVTWSSIVGAAAFREGIEDYQAGRAPQPTRSGRRVSRFAIADFGRQYGPNGIL